MRVNPRRANRVGALSEEKVSSSDPRKRLVLDQSEGAMGIVRNIKTLLNDPVVARDYLNYWGSRLKNSGAAVRSLPGGIKLTEFCDFSEYHAVGEFVSDEEREFLSTHPIGSGAIIDVGANLGIVSFILAKRFPQRTIHAFEPVPSTFHALTTNIEINACPNIRALQCAVADQDGQVIFNADPVGRAINSIAVSKGDFAIKVRCATLDTYAEENSIDQIAFLKVDVEGFEAAVFQGARRTLLKKGAALIYYEVCPVNSKNSGIDPELPTRLLIESGYKIRRISPQGRLEPVGLSDVRQTVLDNWVAVRP
jgi:FkbM family methyltransferase